VDVVLTELLYFIAAVCLCVLAIVEWAAAAGHWARHPGAYAIAAIAVAATCTLRFRQARPRIKQLRLGRDGERTVGEYLERLRAQGALVFHDVPGEGFNLDHVVLCSRGFYVIETKTWMKPAAADARITLVDGSLLAAGQAPDRDPIKQARAGAAWLSRFLEESTRRVFRPRGVILSLAGGSSL
jgi:hypothetical protein